MRDGTIIPLTKDHIFEKEVVKTKGLKIKQKKFSLPGVTGDCIIEYMIEYEMDTFAPEWVIQKDIALLKAELRWNIAQFTMSRAMADIIKGYVTPNYLWLNRLSKCDVTHLPNIKKPKTLLFESGFIPAFEKEPHSLPETSLKTKLICYYGSDAPAEAYWGDQSRIINKNMELFCEKNRNVKKALETFGDLPTDEEKIKKAFEWVQENITNLSYADLYDPKDVEKKKKLEPKDRKSVSDVLKYGYGSRLEINYVFCDMLREMNIDAKFGRAKDRMDDLFVKDAKYWQFDQSLVMVENSEKQYSFYSPGHVFSTVDQVPWFIECVTALLGGTESYMVNIPFSMAPQSKTSCLYDFTFDEDFAIAGTMSARITGHPARGIRLEVFDEDPSDHNRLLTEVIKGNYPNAELTLESCENLDLRDQAIVLHCTLDFGEVLPAGDKILFKPLEYISDAKNEFYASERKYGILFDYAFTDRETVQFTLPPGWRIEALPPDTIFQNEAGQCIIDFEASDNALSVQRLFTLFGPFWGVDQYPIIQTLYQARQDFADQIVIFTKTSGGDIKR